MPIELLLNSGQPDQRRVRRSPVALVSTVRERSRSAVPAKVIDLSVEGCRIESGGVPLEGNQVWVRLEGLESLSGRVAWSQGYVAGVSFAQPLHAAVAARFTAVANDRFNTDVADAGPPMANLAIAQPLQTRREQIMNGQAANDHSPLKRIKAPSATGISGVINRQVMRRADHRGEDRFGDMSSGGMDLRVDDVAAAVENVSPSGLCVRGLLDADIGSPVSVAFSGCEPICGHLIWRTDDRAGISLPPASIDLYEN